MTAFPGVVQPISEIDGELMAHLRYPEDLFKVQRELLARYHVTDPAAFFTGRTTGRSPDDPTSAAAEAKHQPPYYLTLQMPGPGLGVLLAHLDVHPEIDERERANVLTGFVAVDADAGAEAGRKADGYGTLRLL